MEGAEYFFRILSAAAVRGESAMASIIRSECGVSPLWPDLAPPLWNRALHTKGGDAGASGGGPFVQPVGAWSEGEKEAEALFWLDSSQSLSCEQSRGGIEEVRLINTQISTLNTLNMDEFPRRWVPPSPPGEGHVRCRARTPTSHDITGTFSTVATADSWNTRHSPTKAWAPLAKQTQPESSAQRNFFVFNLSTISFRLFIVLRSLEENIPHSSTQRKVHQSIFYNAHETLRTVGCGRKPERIHTRSQRKGIQPGDLLVVRWWVWAWGQGSYYPTGGALSQAAGGPTVTKPWALIRTCSTCPRFRMCTLPSFCKNYINWKTQRY